MNDPARREVKYENDLSPKILTDNVQLWSHANVQHEYLNISGTLQRAMTKPLFLEGVGGQRLLRPGHVVWRGSPAAAGAIPTSSAFRAI
jgi:hypothetical protein